MEGISLKKKLDSCITKDGIACLLGINISILVFNRLNRYQAHFVMMLQGVMFFHSAVNTAQFVLEVGDKLPSRAKQSTSCFF